MPPPTQVVRSDFLLPVWAYDPDDTSGRPMRKVNANALSIISSLVTLVGWATIASFSRLLTPAILISTCAVVTLHVSAHLNACAQQVPHDSTLYHIWQC